MSSSPVHVLAPSSAALACSLLASAAYAGNNAWFTTYDSSVERGELELMLMNDFTQPSAYRRASEGQGQYLSHMVELEYGLTRQFASELMIEWFEDADTGDARFTGMRWENRYRIFDRHVPLNPMVYVEYEDLDPTTRYKMEVSGWVKPPYTDTRAEPTRERVFESRLVLSDHFGPVDLAFNAIFETEVRSSSHTAFGYSIGAMWMPGHDGASCPMPVKGSHHHGGCTCATAMPGCQCGHCTGKGDDCDCSHAGMVGAGIELFGGVGDSRRFGIDPARQEHYLGPILVYHPAAHWMVHTQLAMGLSETSDEIFRVNVGYEL